MEGGELLESCVAENIIDVHIIHGGKFVHGNCYIGGKTSFIHTVDLAGVNFGDIEQFVKSLGYHSILKYALRVLGDVECYTFIHDVSSYNKIVFHHIDFDNKNLKVYVECLDDDLTTLGRNDGGSDTGGGENLIAGDKNAYVKGGDDNLGEGNKNADLDGGDDNYDGADKGKGKAKTKSNGKRPFANLEGAERVNRLDQSFVQEEENDVISEYESSDDSPCSLDSDEELGYRRSKRTVRSKIYNANVDHKTLVFEVGMRFKDFADCKEGIRTWAIENGYNIRWNKSSENKLEAKCDGGCPWSLYASKLCGESTFVIKTMRGEHTCVRSSYNRQATSDWLAKVLLPILKRNSNYPAKEIVHDVHLKYGIIVNEDLCYTAKGKALKLLRGSFESHYSKLRSYIAHLQKMDAEGRFLLKTYLDENNQPVFESAYIGFSALRKGFLIGCRRCICFDACFLKTALGGALLAAVAKDCNNKMWPISWAVVKNESEDTWTWFFKNLFDDLNIIDGFGWTFMSDKHRGIINGIMKLTPHAEHRHCARHIYANWKKQFPGPKLHSLFYAAVKCTNETVFNSKMNKLKEESNEAFEQFMDKDPKRFCKSLISAYTKTDTIDNNICESFNNYILKSRDKPIIDMLEDIRLKLLTRMPRIVKILNASSDTLCPNVNMELVEIQKLVRFCTIKPAMDKKFEVHAFSDTVIVDLTSKECSCRSWSLTGIPCFHGLACINHVRDDKVKYVDEFYHRSNCLEAYKHHHLIPFYGENEWPIVDAPPILPPPFVRPPGRLRKNRRKDPNEEPRQGKQKWSNKGARVSCTRCRQFGHNVRSCKEPAPPPQDGGIEPPSKRKVGRPRKPYSAAQDAGSSLLEQREMRLARKGYGVLTGNSGNIYIRPPGVKRTTVYRRREDEGASQSSQVVDERTPPAC